LLGFKASFENMKSIVRFARLKTYIFLRNLLKSIRLVQFTRLAL